MNKKISKYKDFFALAISYLGNIDQNITAMRNMQETKKFDDFLAADMIKQCAQMHANGYPGISSMSQSLLEEKILEEISDNPKAYKDYLNIYGEFSVEFKKKCIIATKLNNVDKMIEIMGDDFKSDVDRKELKEFILERIKIFKKKMMEGIKVEYESIGSIGSSNRRHIEISYQKLESMLYISKSMMGDDVDLFHRINESFTDLLDIQEKFLAKHAKKAYPSYIDSNRSIMDQYRLEKLIKETKNIIHNISGEEANKIISNLKKEALKLETAALNKRLTNELPKGAKELSEEIKSKYESLSLNIDAALKFDLDRRLEDTNKIIKKYLSIDIDYRDELKNIDGKSAYDLMLESLKVVNSDFDKMLKEYNQGIVNDISVLNRKSLSKRIL